jgi:hypothetical protein
MDDAALSYDSLANISDSTACTYSVCSDGSFGMLITMTDELEDGWAGSAYNVTDVQDNVIGNGTLASGGEASDTLCGLSAGCYMILL